MKKRKWIQAVVVLLTAFSACRGMVIAEEQNDFQSFISAVQEGLQRRQDIAKELTVFQDTVPEKDVIEVYSKIAAAEWSVLEEYQGVVLPGDGGNENINQNYIVQAYLDGLQQQTEALDRATGDSEQFWEEWENGYKKRACALVELEYLYSNVKEYDTINSIPDTLIQEMQENVTGAVYEEQEELSYIVQALSGVEMDGKVGYGTRKALKEFQEQNGLMLNGIINEDSVQEMLDELERGNPEAIEAARSLLAGIGRDGSLDKYCSSAAE